MKSNIEYIMSERLNVRIRKQLLVRQCLFVHMGAQIVISYWSV